jgi:hypothetical protein
MARSISVLLRSHPENGNPDTSPRKETTMTDPHFINEVISDVRGIKPGWYAMDDVGNLYSGSFSSHEECLTGAIHPAYEPIRSPPQ